MTVSINGTTGLSAQSVPQAALSPGVVGVGPEFAAYPSAALNLPTGVNTKIPCNVEQFDTNGAYDAANARFQPSVPGYYFVLVSAYFTTNANIVETSIRKNGADIVRNVLPAASVGAMPICVAIVYMNGSTDYIEPFTYQDSGAATSLLANRGDLNRFEACLVRAA